METKRDRLNAHLKAAKADILEARAFVDRQKVTLARLSAGGDEVTDALETLSRLERTLAFLETNLLEIERDLAGLISH